MKYSGPYHGYDGFAIFARDMDLALNSPTWGLINTPWKKAASPPFTSSTLLRDLEHDRLENGLERPGSRLADFSPLLGPVSRGSIFTRLMAHSLTLVQTIAAKWRSEAMRTRSASRTPQISSTDIPNRLTKL